MPTLIDGHDPENLHRQTARSVQHVKPRSGVRNLVGIFIYLFFLKKHCIVSRSDLILKINLKCLAPYLSNKSNNF